MPQKKTRPMPPQSREERIRALFPDAPAFRLRQIEAALYDPALRSWNDITTLSKPMRETLMRDVPFLSVAESRLFESKNKDTWKALLKTEDGYLFETVLMENKRGQWTICVSSQIGCAMKCTFCATGTMGLTRSVTVDELADQYRYWMYFLSKQSSSSRSFSSSLRRQGSSFGASRISNVVFMGMGEPLANYENVKRALITWLRETDLGPTRITVSSVGILPQLEKLLTDPEWPRVRIAISLHSANQERRKEIVPTTVPNFLRDLAEWSRRYQQVRGKRRHHVTYEYTLLHGVNDTLANARELATYIKKTGCSKINVIPWNAVPGKPFTQGQQESTDAFKAVLRNAGLTVTQRKTMGADIAAACGQLVVAERKK